MQNLVRGACYRPSLYQASLPLSNCTAPEQTCRSYGNYAFSWYKASRSQRHGSLLLSYASYSDTNHAVRYSSSVTPKAHVRRVKDVHRARHDVSSFLSPNKPSLKVVRGTSAARENSTPGVSFPNVPAPRHIRSQRGRQPGPHTPVSVYLLVRVRLKHARSVLLENDFYQHLGLEESSLLKSFDDYTYKVLRDLHSPSEKISAAAQRLKKAALGRWREGLDFEIKYSFYGYLNESKLNRAVIQSQKLLTDMRFPGEWYAGGRSKQRHIHLHVGPTNSGKTYRALKRLEEVDGKGVYAGPLRLLAHEVYMRLNARGKPCKLLTGEEQRDPSIETDLDSQKWKTACTVEMIPLGEPMKVAVIDEIQLIGSDDRGWAWTQAFLGVDAEEIHLCGEERAVNIVEELAAAVGDKISVHRYKRLSPLQMAPTSLTGSFRDLKKGDCIVAFSVVTIHALRQTIEKACNRKVAVIYGALPPETRAQQAKLFNDPDNDYDFLVASDAVGMGLNLNIRRMIFHTCAKFFNGRWEPLEIANIKQIAGRAGRFSTAEDDMKKIPAVPSLDADKPSKLLQAPATPSTPSRPPGLVTTLEQSDFDIVKTAMETDPAPITSAGLFPPAAMIENFAKYFPSSTPFSFILLRIYDLAQQHPRFHLCDLENSISTADIIEPVRNLSVSDRLIFCAAPVSARRQDELALVQVMAHFVADNHPISISDIEQLNLELLDEICNTKMKLRELETLHKGVMLYIWLSYRFSGIFLTRNLALHIKTLVEEKIASCLASLAFDLEAIDSRRKEQIKRDREAQRVKLQLDADEGPPVVAPQTAGKGHTSPDLLFLNARPEETELSQGQDEAQT